MAWLAAMLGAMAGGPAAAAERWAVSFALGGHLPDLAPLSDGLYKAPLMGRATVLVQEGGQGTGAEGEDADVNETEIRDFRYDNPVPGAGIATHGAIELQWHPNERHTFVFGIGSMEKTSISRGSDNLPLQQYNESNTVISERRDKISYTEYTLGWQYNFFRGEDYRIYSRLSLHEVFDIDFREDFIFLFVESPVPDLVGVRRDLVVEAQTASLLMGQIGLGAEWFVRDWLSFAVEGGALMGESNFRLRDVDARSDFLDSDEVRLIGMPYARLPDGTLGYLSPSATLEDLANTSTRQQSYEPMDLSFDGWRLLFRVNLYF